MGPLSKALLLFTLNWLDAQLTLLWVKLDVASEGNSLMAHLLNHGAGSFLLFKLFVGAFSAYILYRCAHLPLARRGMTFVLCLYSGLMVIHVATGCSALGWQAPLTVITYFAGIPQAVVHAFA